MNDTPLPLVVWAMRQVGLPEIRASEHKARSQAASWSWPSTSTTVPAEAPPLVGERFEGQGLGDRGQALNFVVVDDGDQVVEPVVGGEEDRLPVRALVAFAVAQQDEHAVLRGFSLAA